MTQATQQKKQRIDEIERLATDVFGSKEKGKEWLGAKNLALGATPKSKLDTIEGATEVRKILTTIATGGVV
jgi:uncharacterized protein (DUF2384 family)